MNKEIVYIKDFQDVATALNDHEHRLCNHRSCIRWSAVTDIYFAGVAVLALYAAYKFDRCMKNNKRESFEANKKIEELRIDVYRQEQIILRLEEELGDLKSKE